MRDRVGAGHGLNVVALTGSPALDRIVVAAGAAQGGTVRAREVLDTAGGKAVHVASVAALLGAAGTVVLPLGGRRGAYVRSLLEAEPVTSIVVETAGETRRTTTVLDPGGGDVLEILEPAPALTRLEGDALVSAGREAARGAVAVVTGSAPAGAPDLPTRLARGARDGDAAFIVVDTSGDALAAALTNADLVSPNVAEAAALLDTEPPASLAPSELAGIARALIDRGARKVWLSAGAAGTVLVDGAGATHLFAPGERARINAVGCGDALLGGLAAGLAEGLSLEDAASLGVAAATDKLGHVHPARVAPAAVRRLLAAVRREPVRL